MTLKALDEGVDPHDAAQLGRVADAADVSFDGGTVVLNGADVTGRIRSREVTEAAPLVAAQPRVRKALVRLLREAARRGDVVMEGRDIGSVVVPDAILKVFLTASPEERARRRVEELGLKPNHDNLTRMERSLSERDEADAGRATSPLVQADDAIAIDTTNKTIGDLVTQIVGLLKERLNDAR